MPLPAGAQFGPYDILAPIGTGGMGEVYRAHDRRLGRDVAIKVAGEAFTDRFEREARAVATLNHPNICTLHDVGPNYLVMELIEGPTLADRIHDGPIPLDEALALASQIAQALEAAHDRGIVHRDLKPSNIKIREDGTLKVLDFGLAKLATAADDRQHAGGGSDPADAPTVLNTDTQAGLVLGTAAYMAPEQARGKAVDKRADVWAFGVVLWEMLTGRRLFVGDSTSDTLAAVLRNEPDFLLVPPRVRPLLRHCLEKDPKHRLRDIGDWTLLVSREADAMPLQPSSQSWLPWGLAVTLGAALALALVVRPSAPASGRQSQQFAIPPPGDQRLAFSSSGSAVSPDGRYIVATVGTGNGPDNVLWLRPLGTLVGSILPGTEGANYPAWSPDSQSIVFAVSPSNELKRVSISGGSPQVLCRFLNLTGSPTWNRDGTIVFGGLDGLAAVPQTQNGGTARVLTDSAARKEGGHLFPQFLPDGKRLIYFVQSNDPDTEGAYVTSLEHPEERTRILATRDKVLYVAPRSGSPAYLLFLRDQTLVAQRVDASSLTPDGDPISIADGFAPASGARGQFWASETGLLAFRRTSLDQNRRLIWIDRTGKREEPTPDGLYQSFRLSPDGKAVAYDAGSGIEDLWRFDFFRRIKTKLTSDAGRDVVPAWSPDGSEIAYMSNRTGIFQLYRKDAGDIGQGQPLTSGPHHKYVTDWSRTSNALIYYEIAQDTREDLWALPLADESKPIVILNTPARERFGVISTDGKWIAYTTDESGREEVEVRPFATGRKWAASTEGGTLPRWSRDGKTLFFLTLGRNVVMAVDVSSSGSSLETTGQPRVAFTLPSPLPTLVSPYDVLGNGERVLVMEPTAQSEGATPMTVVLDWQAALLR